MAEIDLTTVSSEALIAELESRCEAMVFAATGLTLVDGDAADGSVMRYNGPIVPRIGLCRVLSRENENCFELTNDSDDEG